MWLILNLLLLFKSSKEVSTTFVYMKVKTLSINITGVICCHCLEL